MTTVYSYTYGLAGELTLVRQNGAVTAAYAYDSNANRLSFSGPGGVITGSYDLQDRLLQYGSTVYTMTVSGELASKRSGGQTTTYDYDELGNLAAVTLPDGAQVSYLVDGRQRRVGKGINGVPVQGLLYQDQLQPVAELDGAGQVVSRFIYASRANAPDYLVKGGQTYRIIADHLGSPRLVVDAASGVVAQRLDYDALGRVTLDTNPGFQPFGFAGGLYDPQTGLVRFGARDYDAETGRWTTRDPILFGGGQTNLYVYVENDPVNTADPDGQWVATPAKGLIKWLIKKAAKGMGKKAVDRLLPDNTLNEGEDELVRRWRNSDSDCDGIPDLFDQGFSPPEVYGFPVPTRFR